MAVPDMRSQTARATLAALATKYFRPTDTLIEVGSWTGESAVIFAEYVTRVIYIDSWHINITSVWDCTIEDVHNIFVDYTRDNPKISTLRMLSVDAAALFADHSADVIYIDTTHKYEVVSSDIAAWRSKARRVLCGHDYKPRFPGCIRAVDEAFGKPDEVFPDSSWVKVL